MIAEVLMIGLELAILAGMANKDKKEVEDKPVEALAVKRNKTKVADRVEPHYSNSGERFVECPIEGFRSYYQVGDWGTIKKPDGNVLKQGSNYGKAVVNLRSKTRCTTCTVERLVALAYLVRPAKGDAWTHEILHKNGNVDDNRATNLMWK